MEKIGLIAGNRKFPLIFAEAAKKANYSVVAVGIRGDTSPRLNKLGDKVYWVGLGELRRIGEIFKREGVSRVAMAGQISPRRLFSREVQQNEEIKSLLSGIKDRKADTIFGAIAEELEKSGIELMDSTAFVKELLPAKGTLTRKEPAFDGWEDIYFGFDLAKSVAGFDIGQTVAVKDKAVVAVEALEGTDRLIRRAGKIVSGVTVVKVSKPRQDTRFDVPVVGLNTIKSLIRSKAACLAIEAGKTLFIDKGKSVELADRKGICVVAV